MAGTVTLHVGLAKTGTTYLQQTLFGNRRLLSRHGVLYPAEVPAAHFFASLDLRQATFQGHAYEQADGAWERLVRAVDRYAGAAVVSHETLAVAPPAVIRRALTDFSATDVRVVITARDLARQIPAVWQEQLKNTKSVPYPRYLRGLLAAWDRDNRDQVGFWVTQDVAAVARRWAAAAGPGNVSVVTVPPAGAARDVLWKRFAAAMGLPEIDYVFPETSNSSLGVAEAELLRRMNPRLARDLEWPQFDHLVKHRLVELALSREQAAGRLTLPVRRLPEVESIAADQVARLEELGVRIVGDLADLTPEPSDPAGRQPQDLSTEELLNSALAVLVQFTEAPLRHPPPRRRSLPRRMAGRLPGASAVAERLQRLRTRRTTDRSPTAAR